CAQSIIDGEFGVMIGIVNNETKRIPLEETAGKLKYVDPDSQIIKEAKLIGISFGD
ncbi:MAG: 6-phosphofructokinase, partial [Lachnospiraceae bacterium]|nr:6-phosphofructokinase [Lachnospiraceae bacterium]